MTILKALLWIWQIPQHIVGLILLAWYRPEKRPYTHYWIAAKMRGAISLGEIRILGQGCLDANTVNHEFGHTIQSRILGPLYLLIVGLPSILHAIWYRWWWDYKPADSIPPDYYAFWTEKWADRLGKVKR